MFATFHAADESPAPDRKDRVLQAIVVDLPRYSRAARRDCISPARIADFSRSYPARSFPARRKYAPAAMSMSPTHREEPHSSREISVTKPQPTQSEPAPKYIENDPRRTNTASDKY